jgi:hypothetical protein
LDAGLLRSPQSAAVESHRRLRWISILCAGQARRSSRWIAQSLRSEVSPEAERVPTGKPSRRAGPVSPGYRVATGGLAPTASGANSVASALGASPGATPARLCEHTMRVAPQPSKPELSTWLGVGTFYLAPTTAQVGHPVMPRRWRVFVRILATSLVVLLRHRNMLVRVRIIDHIARASPDISISSFAV